MPGPLWQRSGAARATQDPTGRLTTTPKSVNASVRRIRQVMDSRSFETSYQPIVDLVDGRMIAAEALTHFPTELHRRPHPWYSEARQMGIGAELELVALEAALARSRSVMDRCILAFEVSSSLITHKDLPSIISSAGSHGVVLVLSEHATVRDYGGVRKAAAMVRDRRVRLAVGNIGATFAGLRHILNLSPDVITLGRELIEGIVSDPMRQSLVKAMVTLASDIGADLVAQGIETAGELETVRTLGVCYGQGRFIAPPVLPETLAAMAWKARGVSRYHSRPRNERKGRQDIEIVLDDLEAALLHVTEVAAQGMLGAKRAELVALDQAAAALACISGRQALVAGTAIWKAAGC